MRELRCRCGRLWGRVENGAIIVESRHGGQVHVNSVSLLHLMVEGFIELAQTVDAATARVEAAAQWEEKRGDKRRFPPGVGEE